MQNLICDCKLNTAFKKCLSHILIFSRPGNTDIVPLNIYYSEHNHQHILNDSPPTTHTDKELWDCGRRKNVINIASVLHTLLNSSFFITVDFLIEAVHMFAGLRGPFVVVLCQF